ncbi:MAG: MBL fold metallo-hydrolase [Pseudomonadota bacterium]
MTKLTRRTALAAGVATLAAPIAGKLHPAAALVLQPSRQMPGVHHIAVGDITVTAILDGYFDLDTAFLPAAEPDLVEAAQRDAFLPIGPTVQTPVNAFLVHTRDELVLIDTGAGGFGGLGSNIGTLLTNLGAAGVDAGQINRVLVSHLHPDHAAGLIDEHGNAVFQGGPILLHEEDWSFWTNDKIRNEAPEEARPFFDLAVEATAPYVDRLELYGGASTDLGGGIEAVHLPGHTPGHCGYLVSSGNEQLMIFADIVHVAPVQFAHPDWAIAFDVDPELAIATRAKIFDQLATDRLLVTGMHMPFPGFGHIDRHGDAYAFVPMPWQYEL